MPDFTIHELYTSTQQANTSLYDYRNKQRENWTVWDWICALGD